LGENYGYVVRDDTLAPPRNGTSFFNNAAFYNAIKALLQQEVHNVLAFVGDLTWPKSALFAHPSIQRFSLLLLSSKMLIPSASIVTFTAANIHLNLHVCRARRNSNFISDCWLAAGAQRNSKSRPNFSLFSVAAPFFVERAIYTL
jgi:hypothetical protein